MAEETEDKKTQPSWGMLVIGMAIGGFGWHYASKAMQNYGRNRSIDDRMQALDAVYARTIPGAQQPAVMGEMDDPFDFDPFEM